MLAAAEGATCMSEAQFGRTSLRPAFGVAARAIRGATRKASVIRRGLGPFRKGTSKNIGLFPCGNLRMQNGRLVASGRAGC